MTVIDCRILAAHIAFLQRVCAQSAVIQTLFCSDQTGTLSTCCRVPRISSSDSTMDDDKSELLQQFCAITGVDDVAVAMNVLEATNWSLEEAINLQFATGGDMGGPGAAGLGGGAGLEGGAGIPPLDEEEVRAPMPVMRDRLYGDVGMHGVPAGGGIARYGAPPPPDRGPTHIDVFQDFEPQKAAADAAAAAAAAPPGSAAKSNALSAMFKPPEGILYHGDFEAAKTHATDKGRWLLVNVQTADEFASHRLNRDTWGNELVQDMVRETFVLWQVYNTSEVGGSLVMQYHLEQLPAVFIVDPITGAKLWEKSGFVYPDTFIEELVPFLDVGPNHPEAHKLAQRFHTQAAKRRHKSSGSGAAALPDNMSEDDQLALALAMSVEGGGAGPSGRQDSLGDLDEQAIWQEIEKRQKLEEAAAGAGSSQAAKQQPAATEAPAAPAAAAAAAAAPDSGEVQAAAAARLPPEPAAGGCRIAFRLPDGSRVQRNFNTSDTVTALQDYVVSVSKEAAEMSSFVLSEARPGAVPLDPAATIEAAGVAGAMLVIKSS